MATETSKPVVLYTVPTPNGVVASIFLEELKKEYGGPEYECVLTSVHAFFIAKS